MKRVISLVIALMMTATVFIPAIAQEESVLYYTVGTASYPDPAIGSGFQQAAVFLNTYDPLVQLNDDNIPDPNESIAERWEVSDDGLTYTFHIRRGVLFHDLTELTAEDVVFSFNRLLDIGQGFSFLFKGKVASVTQLDEYTAEVVLNQRFGPFISTLIRMYIVNKDLLLANASDGNYGECGDYGVAWLLDGHDAGSGAYKIVDYQTDAYIVSDKFEEYWRPFAPNAPDRTHMTMVYDPTTLKLRMQKRELDISKFNMTPEWYAEVDAVEGIDVKNEPVLTQFYLMMHNQKAPTDDLHFRKALAYLFDYVTVVEDIFTDSAAPAAGCVPQLCPGHNPDVFVYEHNLAKAEEELRMSKYYDTLSDYMPIEVVWCSNQPKEEESGLLLKRDAAQLGIDIELVPQTWTQITEASSSPDTTQHAYFIWVAGDYPEALSLLYSKFHSQATGSWNQTEWLMNDVIDAMIDDALATSDYQLRQGKAMAIQTAIMEICPSIFAYDSIDRFAYQAHYMELPDRANPIMGYFYEMRRINIYPEKKAEL